MRAGISQFLDVGAALPASGLTHEVAQSPAAVMLLSTSILAPMADTEAAAAAVSALLAGLPAGSYVALYHQASDMDPSVRAANRRWNRLSPQKVTLRSRDEVASLVAGLELVPPGLVRVCDWRPAPGDPVFDAVIPLYGVVAKKPWPRRTAPRQRGSSGEN